MLSLDGQPFSIGRSTFRDRAGREAEQTAKVYVRVEVEGIEVLAQLDTGAPWTVLDLELAEALRIRERESLRVRLSTRLGLLEGGLYKVSLTLVADEGQSLVLPDCSVFVADEPIPGGRFLGYTSLLDQIRFALDPYLYHFYFGPPAAP